ncbi:MAG: hypothetical protein ACYCW6_05830 [Candidatus Xenobia bacterium]
MKADDKARSTLGKMNFEEIAEVLHESTPEPSWPARVLHRARDRYDRDAVLVDRTLPRYLYAISAILEDPGMPTSLLDHFLDRLRRRAYLQIGVPV